jgi:phenylacetate-CoA ligase
VLKRIVGRQRNLLILPDGRRVWPSLELSAAEQTADAPPVQQFQLIQRTIDSLELLLVAPRLFTDDEVRLIHNWVDRAIGCHLALKITYVQEIPRGPSGKYEDVRCEVEKSYD